MNIFFGIIRGVLTALCTLFVFWLFSNSIDLQPFPVFIVISIGAGILSGLNENPPRFIAFSVGLVMALFAQTMNAGGDVNFAAGLALMIGVLGSLPRRRAPASEFNPRLGL